MKPHHLFPPLPTKATIYISLPSSRPPENQQQLTGILLVASVAEELSRYEGISNIPAVTHITSVSRKENGMRDLDRKR
jgi:hypothetical protein